MTSDDPRLICFYLPQFHPIPENDAAWGKGYTEWRRVVQAKPLFQEHYQPRISSDLGFYDLRLPESQVAQAELAKQYGIAGFCYYYFNLGGGRKLLERPIEQMFKSGKPDFPFCVSWANHHWRANWVGSKEAIAMQTYSEKDAKSLIDELIPMFRDDRYIKVDSKPLFVVYDSQALPDPIKYTQIWRSAAKAAGFRDLYLCRMEKGVVVDPQSVGFDAAIEFPPSGVRSATVQFKPLDSTNGFSGNVYDYGQTAFYAVNREEPQFKLFRGLIPSWDNTARRPANDATIFHGSTPEAYQSWLQESISWTKTHHAGDERLIFINAWNEWGESAYLEPDLKNGHAYLQATLDAQRGKTKSISGIYNAVYALDKAELRNGNGSKLVASKKISGSVDQITRQDSKISLAGWACDLEIPSRPVNVLVFENGRLLTAERTFVSRPDVAQSVDKSALNTGFNIDIDAGLVKGDCTGLKVVIVSQQERYALLPVPNKVVSVR
ncbi:MAG: glycoside hydrolase family 99-like domain-containing protein [Candidatus Obscuribacterales bacterium]|nr:glycoside hydrolase family 99-like domain-containing protein [Candidatus Obscuribacterales bacterium]